MANQHPLWDLPTRTCHWLFVICVPCAWWSAEEGMYDIHSWLGYTLLVLVLFRIIWGFVGSPQSRFTDFLRGPRAVVGYLRTGESVSRGHNPLGGWSVVVLLWLLLLQATSGLFNNDDTAFQGPFYYMASEGLRNAMGTIHDNAFNTLIAFVLLHILAVIWYQRVKKQPLLQAMVRGKAEGREGSAAVVNPVFALLIVLALALLLWWAISSAPQPQVFW